MSKFNVGDRVAFYSNLERNVYTVLEVDNSDDTLKFNGQVWANQEQCRKIKKKAKFKIGDRVWGTNWDSKKREKGVVTIVYDCLFYQHSYDVKFDSHTSKDPQTWRCGEDKMVKVKMVKKEKVDLKIGDKVEVSAFICTLGARWTCENKKIGFICGHRTSLISDGYLVVFENDKNIKFSFKKDCRKVS